MLRVFVGLSFPAEGARGDARVKFVYRVAVGRIAVDDPLLLVVDGIGHVDVAVVRVDRQPVIFRLPVFEERARRELLGSYGHAPDILVDPWMLRSKHGRDKLFATPELLWDAACEYFQWCDENPWVIDVIYCGYCGCKCTNGSKYNYWTIKDTGERRASRQAIYKCQDAWQGVPHYKVYQFKAEKIEKIVFQAIAEYIDKLQENEDIFEQISENGRKAKKEKAKELSREQERLKHIQQKISVMEDKIPEAMLGEYPVPVDKLVDLIEKQRQEKEQQEKVIAEKQKELDGADVSFNEWDSLRMQIPTWKDVFLNADNPTKRVLVNKLIEKISVKEDEVVIRFKININEIRSKALKKSGSMVPENKLEDKSVILDSLKIYPNPE